MDARDNAMDVPARATDGTATPIATLVRTQLVPLAAKIDQACLYPEAFLHELGRLGGFAGGAAGPLGATFDLPRQLDITTRVGSVCGSTAFLVWCQSTSAWYLLHAPNPGARQRYLEPVARGELLAGSGMSNAMKALAGIEQFHLRARREGDGFIVNGVLPWVSNLGPGHLLLTAAAVADGGYLMFAVPCDAPGLLLHDCPKFSGMGGTNTFNVRFRDVAIGGDDEIATPAQFGAYLARIKAGFVLGQAAMGFGVVQGCLETIHESNAMHSPTNRFLDDQEQPVRAELARLRARANVAAADAAAGPGSVRTALEVRAAASELALRAATSAVLHAGARGYLMRHPAQRRLREAVFVAIVTPALKHLRKEMHEIDDRARQVEAVA